MVNHNPMSGLRFAVFGFVIALAVAVVVAVQMREKKPHPVPQMYQNHKAIFCGSICGLGRSLVVFCVAVLFRYT